MILAPPSASGSLVPLPRTGLLFYVNTGDRPVLVRQFDSMLDTLRASPASPGEGDEAAVSREMLQTLDHELAPYPFDLWEGWKSLFQGVGEAAVQAIFGRADRDGKGGWTVDGLDVGAGEEEGEEGEVRTLEGERVMRHRAERQGGTVKGPPPPSVVGREVGASGPRWARFDLRKSWRAGAEGEEVTTFTRDKSWLFWHVARTQLDGGEQPLLHLLLPCCETV